MRNDIYITVEQGVFEKGTKRSERNVEVAIEVFDGHRNVIEVRWAWLVQEMGCCYHRVTGCG